MKMKIELELTDEDNEAIAELCKQIKLTRAQVVRKALNLFRTYLESTADGGEWLFLPSTSLDDYSHLERITVPGLKL